MTTFVARRLLGAIFTFALAMAIAFFLIKISGDPTANILGPFATPEQYAHLRGVLGLNESLPNQFLTYMGHAFTLDFGNSLQYDQSNAELILERLPATLELLALGMALALFIGLPIGVFAAVKEGTVWDRLASGVALIGQSVPVFWLGLMLVLIFAVNLNWLPSGQSGGIDHLILPAVTLAVWPLAQIARLTRASMAEVLREPYIESARARGISERQVIFVHGLRNAALPVITVTALQAGLLISGAVAVEYVYAYPGFGLLAVDAVNFRDFTLVQAVVAFGVLMFVVLNFAVDMLYASVDPRVRRA